MLSLNEVDERSTQIEALSVNVCEPETTESFVHVLPSFERKERTTKLLEVAVSATPMHSAQAMPSEVQATAGSL